MAKEKTAKELIEEIRKNINSFRFIECRQSFFQLLDMLPGDKEDYDRHFQTYVADVTIMVSLMGFDPLAMRGNEEVKKMIESIKADYPQKAKGEDYRKKLLQSIQGKFDVLLKNIEIDLRCSSGFFQELKSQSLPIDVSQIKATLESFVSREAMLFLHASGAQTKQQAESQKLYEEWEDYRRKIFNGIVTSHQWEEEDDDDFCELLLSPTIDTITSQLMVSAITLSAATFFDLRKLILLCRVYDDAEDEELKQRALVGLLLVSASYVGEYDQVDAWGRIKSVIQNDTKMIADIIEVQKLVAIAVDSEKASRDFSKGMFKSMSLELMKELKQSLSDPWDDEEVDEILMEDDENSDMEEEDGWQSEVDDMQDRGIDVLLSQFDYLKNKTPFFDQVYNWFMPFYVDNPHIMTALKDKEQFAKAFVSTSYSCPADAYALANLFIIDPDGMPKDMEETFDGSEEMIEEKANEDSERRIKSIRISYIRNLYRFFKYFSHKQEFFNMLEKQKTGEFGYAFLADKLFEDSSYDKYRLSIARFAFRRNVPTLVGAMLRNFDDETVEILFMKGWFYAYTDDKDSIRKGVEYFRKVVKQAPDMKKAYLALGFCYSILGETDLYLENFDKLMGLKDFLSEDTVLNLKIDKLEILIDSKRWKEALPLAYELDYTHPEKEQPAAFLTYLLVRNGSVRNGGEHAQDNLQKARERLDAHFEEEDMFSDNFRELEKSSKAVFRQTLGMFFKLLQKDKKAEAYFHYSRGLFFLIDKKWTNAVSEMMNAHAAFKALFGKDKFYDLFLEDGKWLEKDYGFAHADLLVIYNYVMDEFQNTVNNMKTYGKKRK